MEYHIRDMVLAHLPEGWDSLGVHVEFEHTAATLVGEEVEVVSTITGVDRKLIKAETVISDRLGELGRGVHHRIVADMTRNQGTLAKRAASLAALPQPQPASFVGGPPSRHGAQTPTEYLQDLSARTGAMAFGEIPPGFDGYCSGDWIQGFEQEVAALMGKPRGLFVVTGTQAQQCAIQTHAEGAGRTKLFAAHPTSHLLLSEEDAYKHLSGFDAMEIGETDAPLGAAAVREAFAGAAQLPAVLLVEIPQRHNGGATTSYEELVELRGICDEYGVAFHMDGARLWEARPGYDRSFTEICALFDSIYLSFYKGIGAAVGAMLCGTGQFSMEES